MPKNVTPQNRNASIRTRRTPDNEVRTETFRRDLGTVNVAVTTDRDTHSTTLFINVPSGTAVSFDGRTARTIYRILQRHYEETT